MESLWQGTTLATLLAFFALALFGALLIHSARRAWLALLLMLPWSLAWPDPGTPGLPLGGLVLEVPIEPAMALLCLSLAWRRSSRDGLLSLPLRTWQSLCAGVRSRVVRPIDLMLVLIAAHFFWLGLCTAMSVDPATGVKELLVRALVVVSFFFAPLLLCGPASSSVSEPVDRRSLCGVGLGENTAWLLGCSLLPTVLWFALRRPDVGPYLAGDPWFRGHIEYGQLLALVSVLLLPIALSWGRRSRWIVALAASIVLVLVGGVVAGQSRSGLLILASALPVLAVLSRRPPVRTTMVAVVGSFLAGCLVMATVLQARNLSLVAEPTEPVMTPLTAQVSAFQESVVLTDESLTERYNRWHAALAMARQSPVFGFGPGAFEQAYAKYQHPRLRTRFSTEHGDLGDAHSHYLEFLAEQGFPGLAISLLLFVVPLYGALVAASREASIQAALSLCAVATALIGLMVSSLFSTFLSLQEIAPLYFLLAAVAVGSPFSPSGCVESIGPSSPTRLTGGERGATKVGAS